MKIHSAVRISPLKTLCFGLTVLLLAAFTGCSSAPAEDAPAKPPADLQSVALQVEGMDCGGCESAVKAAVLELEGVYDIEVSHKEASARVQFDPARIQLQSIQAAIQELGYQTKTAN